MRVPRAVAVPALDREGRELIERTGGTVEFDYAAWMHRITLSPDLEETATGFCYASTTLCYALAPHRHLHVTPGRATNAYVLDREQGSACRDDPWFYTHVVDMDRPLYVLWAEPGHFDERQYRGLLEIGTPLQARALLGMQGVYEPWPATPVKDPATFPLARLEDQFANDPQIVHFVSQAKCIRDTERTLLPSAAGHSDLLITWQDWDGWWRGCFYSLSGTMRGPNAADGRVPEAKCESREAVEEMYIGKEGVKKILGQWNGE